MGRIEDALLAVHLFGWRWATTVRGRRFLVPPDRWMGEQYQWPAEMMTHALPVPRYTESGHDMLAVIEAMHAREPSHTLNLDSSTRIRRHAQPWFAEFWTWGGQNCRRGHAAADTAPMAVALAALMALGVDLPQEGASDAAVV